MNKYTQEDFEGFKVDKEGYKLCPKGDYTAIKQFPDRCKFRNRSVFGDKSIFGRECYFGAECYFGNRCIFGYLCGFGKKCKYGKGCTFLKYSDRWRYQTMNQSSGNDNRTEIERKEFLEVMKFCFIQVLIFAFGVLIPFWICDLRSLLFETKDALAFNGPMGGMGLWIFVAITMILMNLFSNKWLPLLMKYAIIGVISIVVAVYSVNDVFAYDLLKADGVYQRTGYFTAETHRDWVQSKYVYTKIRESHGSDSSRVYFSYVLEMDDGVFVNLSYINPFKQGIMGAPMMEFLISQGAVVVKGHTTKDHFKRLVRSAHNKYGPETENILREYLVID